MSVARKALEMTKAATEAIVQRAEARYQAHRQEIFRTTDRMFAGLMIVQWIFAIFIAIVFSPYGWQGKVKTVHMHVWVALILGAAITSLPVALAWFRPGQTLDRKSTRLNSSHVRISYAVFCLRPTVTAVNPSNYET